MPGAQGHDWVLSLLLAVPDVTPKTWPGLTSAPEITSGKGEGGPGAESWELTPALGDMSLPPADLRDGGDGSDRSTSCLSASLRVSALRQTLSEADELGSRDKMQELQTCKSVTGHK